MIISEKREKMQPLTAEHLRELELSGLTETPLNYMSLSAEEAKAQCGYELPGLAIFYHQKSGEKYVYKKVGNKQHKSFVRFKPDWKKASEKAKVIFDNGLGEYPKYLTPKGAGSRAYFSLYIKDWEMMSKRAKDDLDITEGEKKADKACLEGFATVGLSGVTCFVDRRVEEPTFEDVQGSQWDVEEQPEQVKPESSKFLPELEEIKWAGRSVGICYDSDLTQKFPVRNALLRLFSELSIRKANPFPIFLPCELNGAKNGLDDFLVRHGKDAYQVLRKACKDVQASSERMIQSAKDDEKGIIISKFKKLEPGNYIKSVQAWCVLKETWAYRSGMGFYQWTGNFWQLQGKDGIDYAITQFMDAQGWVNRSGNMSSFIKKEMETRLKIDELRWNNAKFIGFNNGYLDTTNDVCVPCDRSLYITSILPYEYDKNAKCPEWINFLTYALNGDQELIGLLQAWFKWVLMPKDKSDVFPIQKVLYLIGRKGTGKGTALNVLTKLVGEGNYGGASPKVFNDPEALGRLVDKKLAIDSDATGYLANIGDFNKVVVNEAVDIRTLYVGSDKKRLGCVVVMAMNEFLKTPSSGTEGLDRRICPIPFMQKPKTIDPDLSAKLKQELPGIFQWAWQPSFVEVKKRILFAGRSEFVAEQARERFIKDNQEFQFLCEYFPWGGKVKAKDVYSQYSEWAKEVGLKAMSMTTFGTKIKDLGIESERKKDGVYYDIPIMNEFDLDEFLGIGGGKKAAQTKEEIVIDWNDLIKQSDEEFARLEWDLVTSQQFLMDNYGVNKRPLLSEEQIVEFVAKLKQIPTPIKVEEIPIAKDNYGKELDISFGSVPNGEKLLKEETKTTTRRKWKDSYAKAFQKARMKGEKVAVYNHKGEGGYQIGWILIDKMYQEVLENMPQDHLLKEGGMCETKEQFIQRYFNNDSKLVVWVLEFKFYPLGGNNGQTNNT